MKKALTFFGLLIASGLGAIALGVAPTEGVWAAQAESGVAQAEPNVAQNCSNFNTSVDEGYGVKRQASDDHCAEEK